jgi:pantothenate kinase type III
MTRSTEPFVTIDHGNTNTSILLHEAGKTKSLSFNDYSNSNILQAHPGVLTSVGSKSKLFPEHILNIKNYHFDQRFLDMNVQYSETLGSDRLINAYYIYKNELCPAENILHIDAGTFTTIDLISLNGFEGGLIFPGETTYLQSFNRGENLPSFENVKSLSESYIPNDTESAIKQSYLIFMKGALKEVLAKYAPQSIIITGGNSINLIFILSQINKSANSRIIKYKSIPKLTHKALSFFYEKILRENLQ